MFKVGDMIAGLKNGYNCAGEGMLKAEVVYTRGYPVTMGIRVLDHIDKTDIGAEVEVENRDSYFKLLD